jgi:hypothetical protein
LLEKPELAASPSYVRDDTEILLGGGGVEMSLKNGSFAGWQKRISSLWTGALGHVAPGEELNTKLISHESVVIGGVMFRYRFPVLFLLRLSILPLFISQTQNGVIAANAEDRQFWDHHANCFQQQ